MGCGRIPSGLRPGVIGVCRISCLTYHIKLDQALSHLPLILMVLLFCSCAPEYFVNHHKKPGRAVSICLSTPSASTNRSSIDPSTPRYQPHYLPTSEKMQIIHILALVTLVAGAAVDTGRAAHNVSLQCRSGLPWCNDLVMSLTLVEYSRLWLANRVHTT